MLWACDLWGDDFSYDPQTQPDDSGGDTPSVGWWFCGPAWFVTFAISTITTLCLIPEGGVPGHADTLLLLTPITSAAAVWIVALTPYGLWLLGKHLRHWWRRRTASTIELVLARCHALDQSCPFDSVLGIALANLNGLVTGIMRASNESRGPKVPTELLTQLMAEWDNLAPVQHLDADLYSSSLAKLLASYTAVLSEGTGEWCADRVTTSVAAAEALQAAYER